MRHPSRWTEKNADRKSRFHDLLGPLAALQLLLYAAV